MLHDDNVDKTLNLSTLETSARIVSLLSKNQTLASEGSWAGTGRLWPPALPPLSASTESSGYPGGEQPQSTQQFDFLHRQYYSYALTVTRCAMTGVKSFSVLLAAVAAVLAVLALLLAPDFLKAPKLSPPWLARHLHADTGHRAACRHSLTTPPDTTVSCPAQVDPINLGADWVVSSRPSLLASKSDRQDLATDVNLRNISYHRLAGAIRIVSLSIVVKHRLPNLSAHRVIR